MTENKDTSPGYNEEEEDLFADLWVHKDKAETVSWTIIKGRKTVKNESRAKRILGICEDKSEDVLGGARTAGENCPICKGKGMVECPYCPEDGAYDPVCAGKGFAYCTACRADDFRSKQKANPNNSAERPQG